MESQSTRITRAEEQIKRQDEISDEIRHDIKDIKDDIKKILTSKNDDEKKFASKKVEKYVYVLAWVVGGVLCWLAPDKIVDIVEKLIKFL